MRFLFLDSIERFADINDKINLDKFIIYGEVIKNLFGPSRSKYRAPPHTKFQFAFCAANLARKAHKRSQKKPKQRIIYVKYEKLAVLKYFLSV